MTPKTLHRIVLLACLLIASTTSCNVQATITSTAATPPPILISETPRVTSTVQSSVTAPAAPTTLPNSPTPNVVSLTATPIVVVVSGEWRTYAMPEVGTTVSIPVQWRLGRGEGFYVGGPTLENSPTDSFPPAWLIVGFVSDVPQTLPELTKTLQRQWNDFYLSGFDTTSMTVAGYSAVAFWWNLPNRCMTVYVPAYGLVRHIEFSPELCESGGKRLNQIGQHIFDSVQLQPATLK